MDKSKLKTHLPTIPRYLEKRRKAKANQLPAHLRPRPVWPLGVQLLLNAALIYTLYTMMVNREDYLTESGPAVILVACLLVLISTFINAFRYKRRYATGKPSRWAKVNIVLMVLAFIFWCLSIIVFMS